MPLHLRFTVVVTAAAVAASAAGAQAAGVLPLTFRTVVRGSEPAVARLAGGGSVRVPVGTWAQAVTSAGGLDASLGSRLAARVDTRLSSRRFAVLVADVWPTRGYSVTIEHVAIERLSTGDQLCVVAAIAQPPPGRVVLQERTIAYHVVEARRPRGRDVPQAVVLRAPGGRLLYHTGKGPIGPHLCERS